MHVYEVRPRKDHRGFDLISDKLPFGRLYYSDLSAATSIQSSIRVYDAAGNVLETQEHAGEFKEWRVRITSHT